MIQFSDGKVQNRNTKNQIFYEDILKSTSEKPSSESDIGIIDNQNTSSVMTIWIGGVAVITLLAVILLYRYRKRESTKN